MNITIELRDGLYTVYNGDESDGFPYKALLAIYGEDNIYITEFTTSYIHDEFRKLEIKEAKQIFSKLTIDNFNKI